MAVHFLLHPQPKLRHWEQLPWSLQADGLLLLWWKAAPAWGLPGALPSQSWMTKLAQILQGHNHQIDQRFSYLPEKETGLQPSNQCYHLPAWRGLSVNVPHPLAHRRPVAAERSRVTSSFHRRLSPSEVSPSSDSQQQQSLTSKHAAASSTCGHSHLVL